MARDVSLGERWPPAAGLLSRINRIVASVVRSVRLFPLSCGRCVANMPRLFCAQDDSGSADGKRIHLMTLPRVCRRANDCRGTRPPRTRRQLTRASGRDDPLDVGIWASKADSGATSGRVATSKAGNPQVRAIVLVLGTTCSDQQGACGLSQVGAILVLRGKPRAWGDAWQLRAITEFVVPASTNCLGFRSSPSIRDRQNLASARRQRRRKHHRRNFTRAGCSGCAA